MNKLKGASENLIEKEEIDERIKIFSPFQVNSDLVKNAKDDYLFMHCLPADITDVSCKEGEVSASVFEKNRVFESELRGVVRKHIFRKMKKYPLIVPNVFIS